MNDDRREHPRIEIPVQVSLHHSDDVAVVMAANISAGGVFIELTRGELPRVEIGARVEVALDLGSDRYGRNLDLRAEGEVVRVSFGGPTTSPGFAIMWTSTDAAVAKQLGVILEYLQAEREG